MSYRGWSNYETWCVSLWLNNDQGLYNALTDIVSQIIDDNEDEEGVRDEEGARDDLAEALKAWVDDLCEITFPGSRSGASFVADLLGAALSEVNWLEIATNEVADFEPADR